MNTYLPRNLDNRTRRLNHQTRCLNFELRTVFSTFLLHPSTPIPERTLLGPLSGIREARQSGVAAIGVAQEFQRVWTAYERQTSTGAVQWWFTKADRRVTCYYFYLWDADFGPAFIKVCSYFPDPAKVWINGHEWAKRQAIQAGIGFTELSNGFATCEDPVALQEICDRLGPGRSRCSSNAG
jgi:hypothetical protein